MAKQPKATSAKGEKATAKTKSAARRDAAAAEVSFDYIKSNQFRVIHADGVFGGMSPQGNIHMAFYNERAPIPRHMVHRLEGNILGAEIRERRESRAGFVREVESDVVLALQAAINLHKWLGEKITELEQAKQLSSNVEG